MIKIGPFIQKKRKEIGFTQIQLAERTGVGLRFIRELETQRKESFRMDKVNQVLAFFGQTLRPVPMENESAQSAAAMTAGTNSAFKKVFGNDS